MAAKPEEDGAEGEGSGTDASGLWVAQGCATEQRGPRSHPLFKKLASLSGEVNSMSRGQLKQRLRELGMEPRSAS